MSVKGHRSASYEKKRNRRREVRAAQFQEAWTLRARQGEIGWSLLRGGLHRYPDDMTWVKLEEPIRSGWYRYFVVRHDLANSTHIKTYQRLLEIVQNSDSSNRKDFARRDYERGGKLYPTELKPKTLTEREWVKLDPPLQKYFERFIRRDPKTKVIVGFEWVLKDPWILAVKIRPNYITHLGIPNGDVESERKFINDRLFHGEYRYRHIERWKGAYFDDWGRHGPMYGEPLVLEEELP